MTHKETARELFLQIRVEFSFEPFCETRADHRRIRCKHGFDPQFDLLGECLEGPQESKGKTDRCDTRQTHGISSLMSFPIQITVELFPGSFHTATVSDDESDSIWA